MGQSQAPDPLDYWRERAKYFEQVVVAILVNTPGQQIDLHDANILGYELDAEALEDGGVRLKLRQKQVEVEKGAAVGPTTIGGPCVGGEEGPVCYGAEGPHVHPPGFTGRAIREPQADDQRPRVLVVDDGKGLVAAAALACTMRDLPEPIVVGEVPGEVLTEAPRTEVVDLMEALKASLKHRRKGEDQ